MLDTCYRLNFNHPADRLNRLQNFDDQANRIELNMALLTLDLAPNPVGLLKAGAGRAFDIMSATGKDATGMRFLAGVQLVSGWNSVVTGATFRTVGVTDVWTPAPKLTWTNNSYGGPDENTANHPCRPGRSPASEAPARDRKCPVPLPEKQLLKAARAKRKDTYAKCST